MERLPILIDSPKKLDHQLSSDPDKTPVSNAANTDSEPEDMNQPGMTKSITQVESVVCVCVCRTAQVTHESRDAPIRFLPKACEIFIHTVYDREHYNAPTS